jgi:uncharacterized delta-60 repeat protein
MARLRFNSFKAASVSSRRMLIALTLIILISSWTVSNPVWAFAGELDQTFGMNGKVTTAFSGIGDSGNAVALQTDGKIVVAGTTFIGSHEDFALARYNPNGSLDSTFGVQGKTITDFSGIFDSASAIAIDNNGKIIVAGSANRPANPNFALARYNTDGNLDVSFGNNGQVTTDFLTADIASAVAIQNDGKIVAAGIGGSGFALARYHSDGSLDVSFGMNGKVVTSFTGSSGASALVIQSDGKLLTGGSAHGFTDFALVRYNPDGSLDSSFGINGKVVTERTHFRDTILDIALQSDGKIVAAGASVNDTALLRYSADGSLDSTFGNNGMVIFDFSESQLIDNAQGIVIQPDDKIITAGSTNNGRGFAITRFTKDGNFDATFGNGGKITPIFQGLGGGAHDVALQPDGKIVAVGSVFDSSTGSDFALARYNNDIASFDICLQDESSDSVLSLNSTTGAYQIIRCRNRFTLNGTARLTRKGCSLTLQDFSSDRRIMAQIDTCQNRATASIQIFPQGGMFTLTDRNITNNTCQCPNSN